MKIIKDGKAYVQVKDLKYLFEHGGYTIPRSVYAKALSKAVHMTDSTKDEFIVFIDPKEVELIKKVSYIADYDQIQSMSDEEFKKAIDDSHAKMDQLIQESFETYNFGKLIRLNIEYRNEKHKVVSSKDARLKKKVKLPKEKKKRLFNFTRKDR